jgi:two-component system, NtrC family, sensor histidine kinase HydH
MLKKRFSLSMASPTVLVSLLLLALCVLAGMLLHQEQATSAGLTDDVSSTKAAHDLHESIKKLIVLLRGRGPEAEQIVAAPKSPAEYQKTIDDLNDEIRHQLEEAQRLADKEDERNYVEKLDKCLTRYFKAWQTRPEAPQARTDAIERCIRILADEASPICGALQAFNANESYKSQLAHRQTVNKVVTVLLGIGIVGALAGLLVGYAVSRRLRHAMYHLRVHVHDAATKLGQDLPDVTLQEDADLAQIQQQMQIISRQIEQVVQSLRQKEREVSRAEQLAALGQLAAGVAHEIRNPLTSIKMLVQTLREELGPHSATGDDLQVIDQEIRRMERCLQSFIDYARPPKLDTRPLDLAVPVQGTLALISGRARQQSVAVEFCPPPRPIMVVADNEQLRQLLLNLALNALDAMPLGGTLKIDVGPSPAGDAQLTVRDTGPGIAEKLMPDLFQPFATTKETGLGLGLVTCRRIAETHGGRLSAANQPQGGACFTLLLPLRQHAEDAAPQRQSA